MQLRVENQPRWLYGDKMPFRPTGLGYYPIIESHKLFVMNI